MVKVWFFSGDISSTETETPCFSKSDRVSSERYQEGSRYISADVACSSKLGSGSGSTAGTEAGGTLSEGTSVGSFGAQEVKSSRAARRRENHLRLVMGNAPFRLV